MILRPNVSLLAAFAGILLIYLEFLRPGRILPGCVGSLLLACGFYGLTRSTVDVLAALLFCGAILTLIFSAIWNTRALGLVATMALLGTASYRSVTHPPHLSPLLAIFCSGIFAALSWFLASITRRARQIKHL